MESGDRQKCPSYRVRARATLDTSGRLGPLVDVDEMSASTPGRAFCELDGGTERTRPTFASEWSAAVAGSASGRELVRLAFAYHHAMVYATVRRILGDPAEAEDVTQTAFEILARTVASLRDPAAVPGFLKTTATRECLALAKRRRWWQGKKGTVIAHELAQPRDEADAALVAAAHELLARLEPAERVAVVLKFVEQHSLEEVAEIMETSVSTVRRRLASARARVEGQSNTAEHRLLVAELEVPS